VAYTDKTLTCVDCGASFTFSAEDQEYHASRGFTTSQALRFLPTGSEVGARRWRRRLQLVPRQMFSAVCAECGQTTEVPFEPRGDRPVYCRDCFSKRQPSRGRY